MVAQIHHMDITSVIHTFMFVRCSRFSRAMLPSRRRARPVGVVRGEVKRARKDCEATRLAAPSFTSFEFHHASGARRTVRTPLQHHTMPKHGKKKAAAAVAQPEPLQKYSHAALKVKAKAEEAASSTSGTGGSEQLANFLSAFGRLARRLRYIRAI